MTDSDSLLNNSDLKSEIQSSKEITIKIIKINWDSARNSILHPDGKERIVYFLGNKTQQVVFLSHVIYVPENAYIEQGGAYVKIKKEWVGENVFRVALEKEYDVVVDMHSHPFGNGGVAFSSIDDRSDYIKLPHINNTLTTESGKYGGYRKFTGFALVTDRSSFDGRFLDEEKNEFLSIQKIILIDKNSQLACKPTSFQKKDNLIPEFLSKQVHVFGSAGQNKISQTKIVLCGAGGIGSIVAESILRLGVRELTIIDDDKLEVSNLHRWQGGAPADIGQQKSSLIAEKLARLFPEANIIGLNEFIYSDNSITALKCADIIIGAIDNGVARVFLSRLSAQYAIPYLDGAAQIVKSPQSEATAQYRTYFYIPYSTACFDCSPLPLFDKKQVAMSYVDPTTYEWVKAKGYLDDAPNERMVTVYGINLIVAGMMSLQLQNFLVGNYGVWHYRSNAIEFEQDFHIKYLDSVDVLSELLPTQAVPIGHPLALPDDDCPFCSGRRVGKCNSIDLIYPAIARKSIKFPNAEEFDCV